MSTTRRVRHNWHDNLRDLRSRQGQYQHLPAQLLPRRTLVVEWARHVTCRGLIRGYLWEGFKLGQVRTHSGKRSQRIFFGRAILGEIERQAFERLGQGKVGQGQGIASYPSAFAQGGFPLWHPFAQYHLLKLIDRAGTVILAGAWPTKICQSHMISNNQSTHTNIQDMGMADHKKRKPQKNNHVKKKQYKNILSK